MKWIVWDSNQNRGCHFVKRDRKNRNAKKPSNIQMWPTVPKTFSFDFLMIKRQLWSLYKNRSARIRKGCALAIGISGFWCRTLLFVCAQIIFWLLWKPRFNFPSLYTSFRQHGLDGGKKCKPNLWVPWLRSTHQIPFYQWKIHNKTSKKNFTRSSFYVESNKSRQLFSAQIWHF